MRVRFSTWVPFLFLALTGPVCAIEFAGSAEIHRLPVQGAGTAPSAAPCLHRCAGSVPGELRVAPAGATTVRVELGEASCPSLPGRPILPVLTREFRFDGRWDIRDVRLESGTARSGHLDGQVSAGRPRVEWRTGAPSRSFAREAAEERARIYGADAFWPGRWVDFTAGFDGRQTRVFVRLHPLQWNPQSGEVILLADYTLAVDGVPAEEPTPLRKGRTSVAPTTARHVIIAPEAWRTPAQALAQFHTDTGLLSKVVTLESILSAYTAAPAPTETGFATHANEGIQNYAWETAKILVAYLRDHSVHPQLELITVAGSGEFVPPSYYFAPEGTEPDYNQWIPSDHYYASPDYDWVDNYGLLRISVQSEAELAAYVDKVRRWTASLDPSWTGNASLAGGNPFHSYTYMGEMMNNHVMCADLFSRFHVDRFQLHRGSFTRQAIAAHLQADDFLLHFQVSHGSGRAVLFDEGTELTAEDLHAFPTKDRLPVFISVACMDGAFDTAVYPYDFTESFGEGLIASPGAGIAYIGGSRTNGGTSDFAIDQGNLVYTGTNDTFTLLFEFIKAYRDGVGLTLGRLVSEAKTRFLQQHGVEADTDKAAYVRFVGLGDAALSLPRPPSVTSLTTPPRIALENGNWLPGRIPEVQSRSVSELDPARYLVPSDKAGEGFDLQTVRVLSARVQTATGVTGEFGVGAVAGNELILNKLGTSEGKEGWHFSLLHGGEGKCVDGVLDDWGAGELIGRNPAGPAAYPGLDLTAAYLRRDPGRGVVCLGLPTAPATGSWQLFYGLIHNGPGGYEDNYTPPHDWLSEDLPGYFGLSGLNMNEILAVCFDGDQTLEPFWTSFPPELAGGAAQSTYLNDESTWLCVWGPSGFELELPERFFPPGARLGFCSNASHSIMVDTIPADPGNPGPLQPIFGKELAYRLSTTVPLVPGDVDGDGFGTAADLTVMQHVAAGVIAAGTAPCRVPANGDFDACGRISAADLVRMATCLVE